MSRIIFIQTSTGEQRYVEKEIREMLASGELDSSTLYRTEETTEWRPLTQFSNVSDISEKPPPVPPSQPPSGFETSSPGYAGFWKRTLAWFLDWLVVFLGLQIFFFGLNITLTSSFGSHVHHITPQGVTNILITWLYFALMESSSLQATLGKMAIDIKVTDLDGNRISFGRATGRHFAKIISGLALLIGFIMVAFTEKKQGLHDMLANCLVVND